MNSVPSSTLFVGGLQYLRDRMLEHFGELTYLNQRTEPGSAAVAQQAREQLQIGSGLIRRTGRNRCEAPLSLGRFPGLAWDP